MSDEKLNFDLASLLRTMIEKGASDLHLTVGAPPAFRINGDMARAKSAPLTAEDTKRLCLSLLTEDQRKRFEEHKELDFAFGVKNVARLRANFFMQRGSVAAVFRRILSTVRPLADMGFNRYVEGLSERPHGLILVTGATGSGKSTTLAAFIDKLNRTKRQHIMTIEDPIEFTHSHQMSIVNQREIGTDCDGFATALRQVLREDPDVIMVGEIRDSETAEAALKAAETGHLVFSTLHTNGAINSINRIVQLFPPESQDYIRSLLSFTLEAVLSQALCQRADRRGRVMAYEYLAMTPAIRNLIRDNKLHQVPGQMQMGQESHGMVTLNQSLLQLSMAGVITVQEAITHSPDAEEFLRMVEKAQQRRVA
ncbi:MAG: type IV pilus twitching motility protein PilT [Bdellovibrionales bacterium]|nr:type IV pilus twitching motility protein PilT [Bdellovibrionales bacterium]